MRKNYWTVALVILFSGLSTASEIDQPRDVPFANDVMDSLFASQSAHPVPQSSIIPVWGEQRNMVEYWLEIALAAGRATAREPSRLADLPTKAALLAAENGLLDVAEKFIVVAVGHRKNLTWAAMARVLAAQNEDSLFEACIFNAMSNLGSRSPNEVDDIRKQLVGAYIERGDLAAARLAADGIVLPYNEMYKKGALEYTAWMEGEIKDLPKLEYGTAFDPSLIDIARWRVAAAMRTKDHDTAIALLQDAELAVKSSRAEASDMLLKIAKAYLSLGDTGTDEAIRLRDQCLSNLKSAKSIAAWMAADYATLAELWMELGNVNEARSAADSALKIARLMPVQSSATAFGAAINALNVSERSAELPIIIREAFVKTIADGVAPQRCAGLFTLAVSAAQAGIQSDLEQHEKWAESIEKAYNEILKAYSPVKKRSNATVSDGGI